MRLAVGMLLVLLWAGCVQSDQARSLRVGYRAAAVHHYRYQSTLTGTERTLGGAQRRDDAQRTAEATWRVLSVDRHGAATIEQTLSDDSQASGSRRFTLTPDGLVAAGPAAGAITVPGTVQFLAILPGWPVRPGDRWTSDIRLPGQLPLRAQSHFDRYDSWRGTQVAVVSTRITGPFDLAGDRSPLHYRGTVDGRSTTWLDPATGSVVKVDSAVATDFTAAAGENPASTAGFTGTFRLQLESTDPAPG